MNTIFSTLNAELSKVRPLNKRRFGWIDPHNFVYEYSDYGYKTHETVVL